jgi:hypothetical protein
VRYLRHLIMAPHTIRWGIISTGGIATKFSQVSTPHSLRFYSSNRVNHVIYPPSECSSHAQDILVDPSTRDVSDVAHKIAAVGSRSVASAQAFIDKLKAGKAPFDWGAKNGLLDNTKAYGSYEEVYNDPVSLASRVCYIHWYPAYIPPCQCQGCPSGGQKRPLREAVHPRHGRA